MVEIQEKYSAKNIEKKIKALSSRIKLSEGNVVLILMNGGAMFGHKLLSYNMYTPLRVDYMKLESYEGSTRHEIHEVYSPDMTCYKGKRVIVLDDICDSGNSLKYVHGKLKEAGIDPLNIEYYTLVHRVGPTLDSDMQYEGLIEEDTPEFLYGYGMDDNGEGRNLGYIGISK